MIDKNKNNKPRYVKKCKYIRALRIKLLHFDYENFKKHAFKVLSRDLTF